MGSGIQAVGSHPFSVDPGVIAPEVLRVLWSVLLHQLGAQSSDRLLTAVSNVGLAGMFGALVSQRAVQHHLGEALELACQLTELQPDTWRRYGSHLCEAAARGGQGVHLPPVVAQALIVTRGSRE
jgi:hypothetical protein